MSRYIDADALRKAFYKDRVSVCSHVFSLVNPLDSEDLAFEIYNMIDAAPTVDAVPVVRCKDCKYDGRCMFQSFVIDNSRDEVPYDKNTFYCVDGERKDGEHE